MTWYVFPECADICVYLEDGVSTFSLAWEGFCSLFPLNANIAMLVLQPVFQHKFVCEGGNVFTFGLA